MAEDFSNLGQGLGQGLGQIFGGLLGGMAEGPGWKNGTAAESGLTGQGDHEANPFAEMLGQGLASQGADGVNPFAEMLNKDGEGGENALGGLFANALGQMQQGVAGKMSKKDAHKWDLNGYLNGKRKRKQTEFDAEETLDADKCKRKIVESCGGFSADCWDYEKLPQTIKQIDFHGDGYFTDHFVHLLSTNHRMSFAEVQMVDLRGCHNLTDVGLKRLSVLLRNSRDLHTILLGGCTGLTTQGVDSFQQLLSAPTLSVLGTGVTSLPDTLWNEDTQTQGCPLLKQRDDTDDLKTVHTGKIVIHQDTNAKFCLSSLLSTKTKEKSVEMKYHPSWRCEDWDFTILETQLTHPLNHVMGAEVADQVLVTVNLDEACSDGVRHIMDTIDYHMACTDSLAQYRKSWGGYIRPRGMVNCIWDNDQSSLIFTGISPVTLAKMEMDDSADDSVQFGILEIVLDKSCPDMEFVVECNPEESFKLEMKLPGDGFSDINLTFNHGDRFKWGIKNPEDMTNESVLSDDGLEFYMSVNEEQKDKVGCFLSFDEKSSPPYISPSDVRDAVQRELGVTCWMEEESGEAQDLSEEAMHALQSSSLVLVFPSDGYSESEKCMKEIETALSLNKKVVFINIGDQGRQWKKKKLGELQKKAGLRILDLMTNPEGEKLMELVRTSVKIKLYEDIADSWEGGNAAFIFISSSRGALRFLGNHGQMERVVSSRNCNEMVFLYDDHNPHSIIDHSSGVIRTTSETATLQSLHCISKDNSELSFRVVWHDNEESKSIRLSALSTTEDYDEDDDDTVHAFELTESGTEIRMVVENIQAPYVEENTKYQIKFYKNTEMVSKASLQKTYIAPMFLIHLDKECELHPLNHRPPPWFCAQMDFASKLPKTCFLVPGHVERRVTVNDTTLSFAKEPLWTSSEENDFRAKTSLTKDHPSFEVVVIKGEGTFYIGAPPLNHDLPLFDSNGFRPEKAVPGDVIVCSLKTDSLKFDQFGIPHINQKVTLLYTVNGKQEHASEVNYLGGGLHPSLAASDMELRLNNMDFAASNKYRQMPYYAQKQFVVVATTQEKSSDECSAHLQKLKESAVQQLKLKEPEVRLLLDADSKDVPTGFCGDLVGTRMETQRENWHHLIESLSEVMTFVGLNINTLEGYDKLTETLVKNQKRQILEEKHKYELTATIRHVLDSVLDTTINLKVMSQHECTERWGLHENQLQAIFKLLHKWGKVIFIATLTPWAVILDVAWFLDILVKLHSTVSDKTAGNALRCLHPTTPVWEMHHLKAMTGLQKDHQRKLVLDVLLSLRQLIRLTGFRKSRDDAISYLVNPHQVRDPGIPLSHFYDLEEPDPDVFTVTVTFKLMGVVDAATRAAVLTEATRISPPVLLAPTYLVEQIGASQVVLTWYTPQADNAEEELRLIVSTFLPLEEVASRGVVTEYTFTVLHCFEDIICHTLLSAKMPFIASCDSERHMANLSICSSHRWTLREGDQAVSVCTLCTNCSEGGLLCEYNQLPGPYDVHQCQCQPHILCCQDCGLCPTCVKSLWDIRSALRPCNDIRRGMDSRPVPSGILSFTHAMMTPTIFNEVTVVKTEETKDVKAINIGLLMEDGEHFVQLFPGKALIGDKDQSYHQRGRQSITADQIKDNPKMSFDLGDQISIQMSEPQVRSLDQLPLTTFRANILLKVDCSLSRASNIVRGKSQERLGMVLSYLPISNGCLYFDAEIVSLRKDGFTGVGLATSVNMADCIGHGTGHNITSGCKAWTDEQWQVGDMVGCGVSYDEGSQQVVFTHNDQVVCKHPLLEDGALHAAVLVREGEAIRILRSNLWMNVNIKVNSGMPDEDVFESETGAIRIYPKKTLLFEKAIGNKKHPSSSVYIENKGNEYLLCKIRINTVNGYISNPNKGIIRPGEMLEITNECNTADRDITQDRFQIVYLLLTKDEVGENGTDKERANQLWEEIQRKPFSHIVTCQWKENRHQMGKKEETFPEELDYSNFDMVEPSYQVTVLKNGGQIASYWLPKAQYRFAIETDGPMSALNNDIVVNAPSLPVMDPRESFRVGMRVNVAIGRSLLSQSFEEVITSVCPEPSAIYAVCQVDMVEYGTPDILHLSFHGSPKKDEPAKRLSLKLPVNSPSLMPVNPDLPASDEVSVSVSEGNVVQLVGFSPNTCRSAPLHLFQEGESGADPISYSGVSCENLLFGAHMVHLWQDKLNCRNLPALSSPTYLFLPAKLTADILRHPSLHQLHDFTKMKIYLMCQVTENGGSHDWHLLDCEAITPEGTITNSMLYRNIAVMFPYIDLASKKVRLPSYNKMLQADGMARHQVEALMLSMLRTYAMTAQLLAIPRYMKMGDVDTQLSRTWEPLSILPLDFEQETICSTHSAETGFTGPYAELARHCYFLADEGSTAASTATRLADCFTDTASSLQDSLSKTPWLKTLRLDGEETTASHVRLSLPELTELVNASPTTILIDNCPKLTSWEGQMTNDVEKQLQLLTRCMKLEKIYLHENRVKQLPSSIGDLRMLTTLHITESHLTDLPASFKALKNLQDLRIIGPLAQWNKRDDLILRMDEIKKRFPFVTEKKLNSALKDILPDWDGSELRVRNSDQRGKILSALFVLAASLGKREGGVHDGFPPEILQLTSLRHLTLTYQAIRSVPPQISRLEKLETLELDGCLNLEVLPPTLGFLPLKRLSLQHCLSLRTPSREIVERGTEAVSAYLKQMASGRRKNWRTKLMLVGIGGAGKTTLLRALQSNAHCAKATTDNEITHGIDIDTWTARDNQRLPGKEVTFSAWDFAGQTVFYNTHQFFLSDRAVYLLVWSTRQGFDNSGLEFWLSSIQCHSPDTPVFVIATHADRLTTDLPRGQLLEMYPQIKGFFFVGSLTGKGIPELKAAILDAALDLDYMGEDVPAVYLDLEKKLLSLKDEETPYIEWSVVRKYAMEVGIFEEKDVARAVQFLQHIGSVQYFDYAMLRDYVVISPQWIVGAMASVVTFKDSVIQNGRLYHKHTGSLWKEYPVKLHEWLLRLTEIFDLTFQINMDVSLVPCLLPNEKPDQAKWPPRDDLRDSAMMLIVYTFRYLPTGLFNRLQARLFEFSNGKTVWKRGSILEKKGHFAYIRHERDQKLSVQVIGQHPENILFLIHETLEDLINLSYRGIQFEYLIPCPDCIKEVGMDEPAMFGASLVREASKCAAPYLQCRRLFHTVPMAVAKALMPPDDNQELDLQLQRSMESLGEMRNELQTDVFMLFSPADMLSPAEASKKVDPRRVLNSLQDKYKCYFDENIGQADIQSLMASMQAAKTLLVFISNNFVKDARCSQLLQYAHSAFQDRFCLVNLSPDYAWKHDTAGFILSQKVFINMKSFDENQYKEKLDQLDESIKEKLGQASKTEDTNEEPVCFISYCWNNSKLANASRKLIKKEATICDPRSFKERIEKELGISCWLDVEQTGKRGLFEDITEGLRAADLMVAFVSNEYLASANCMMELRFAVSTLRIPVIFIAVGIGMEWQYGEIGSLQRNAKAEVVDMRKEIPDESVKTVHDFIKENILIPEQRQEKKKKLKSKTNKMSIVELANFSYHEEFELAQRKLMRRLTFLANQQSVISYPRIFTLDFADSDSKVSDVKPVNKQKPDSARKTLTRRRSELQRRESVLAKTDLPVDETKLSLDDPLCVRFLCEHDQGWHITADTLELRGLTVKEKEVLLEKMAPYLARIMTILKHSGVPLNCNNGDEGAAFKQYIIRLAHEAQAKDAFEKSYLALLNYVIERDTDVMRGRLKRCVLSGGRIRWLCREHQKGYRVTVLNTDVSQRTSSTKEDAEFDKAIMEGLHNLKESLSHVRETLECQLLPNIADFMGTAYQDAQNPRMDHLMRIGKAMYKKFKNEGPGATMTAIQEAFESRFCEEDDEEETSRETPTFDPHQSVRSVSRSSSVTSEKPVPRPRTGSATTRTESGMSRTTPDVQPSIADRRAAFRGRGSRASIEQRQAAQMMMQSGLQNGTSQACVLL